GAEGFDFGSSGFQPPKAKCEYSAAGSRRYGKEALMKSFLQQKKSAFLIFGVIASALGTQPLAAGEIANSFKVAIESKLVMEIARTKKKINADTDFHYTWKRKHNERTLSFDMIGLRVLDEDKEVSKTTMARREVANLINGELKEIPFKEAPPELKSLMEDTFESPLCILEIDGTAKRTKRKVVAGPGAKALVENGQIENAMIFHPPFHKDKNKWDAPCSISMGNGGFVRGSLTYEKKENDYLVSGALAAKNMKLTGPVV